MKIEKISDNQIRCTLTRADLADRELKISELAYGSEKAKSLFHDMIQQAAHEFGFEADDAPLMIEAIPTSSDCIVLIITKVDNPEELDARFSKFAPSLSENTNNKMQNVLDKLEGAEHFLDLLDKVKEAVAKQPESMDTEETENVSENTNNKMQNVLDKLEGAEHFLDLLDKVKEAVAKQPESMDTEETENDSAKSPEVRLFIFDSLDSVIHASHLLAGMYFGSNSLYKDAKDDVYILVLSQSEHTLNDFNRVCNMLTEYASLEKADGATLAYLEEHCELIVSKDAVQKLASI